jgi:hypothetical protein
LSGEQEQAHQAGHQDHGLDVVHVLLCDMKGSNEKERDPVRSAFAWTKVSL